MGNSLEKLKILEKDRKEFIDNYYLNLGDVSKIRTTNIIGANEIFQHDPVLGLVDFMSKPENFYFTCKYLLNLDLHPYQIIALQLLWSHPFSIFIGSRGAGKSFCLAVYVLLLALFVPGHKIILTGSSFRQAKIIFNNCEQIWRNAPIFQDLLSVDKSNRPSHEQDMFCFRIFESTIIAIPTGDGEKIRGQRAGCLIVDEFNSVDVNVYEEVMVGFGAVESNPVMKVKDLAKMEALLKMGDIDKDQLLEMKGQSRTNQQIISGTPGFTFEHFYRYFKRYKEIILSRGNKHEIERIFGGEIPIGFDWKDYCIIRLPYDILPKGYMAEKIIGKAKATSNTAIYNSEFMSVFIADSNGFFKRTLIEKCVCGNTLSPIRYADTNVEFGAMLHGSKEGRYVLGIDPAAASDNLAIVLIEIWPNHRRIVYCWTINEKKHKEKLKRGMVEEHDYYRYCCRKIRDLMKVFKVEFIVLDAQGGGTAIRNILGDPNHLKQGEYAIFPVVIEGEPQDTDFKEGLHMLHMIQFAKAEWVHDANHNLRQDFETRELLFPLKDSLAFGMAREEDILCGRAKDDINDNELANLCDTLEDCMLEIEELKNELVLIEHTKTPSGRDKFDVPTVKGLGNQKKGKLRKDRYSALLMANAVGRTFIPRQAENVYMLGNTALALSQDKKKNKRVGLEYGMAVNRSQHRRF